MGRGGAGEGVRNEKQRGKSKDVEEPTTEATERYRQVEEEKLLFTVGCQKLQFNVQSNATSVFSKVFKSTIVAPPSIIQTSNIYRISCHPVENAVQQHEALRNSFQYLDHFPLAIT